MALLFCFPAERLLPGQDSGPGGQVSWGGELRHLSPCLGRNYRCDVFAHSGDSLQEFELPLQGTRACTDLLAQLRHLLLQKHQMIQTMRIIHFRCSVSWWPSMVSASCASLFSRRPLASAATCSGAYRRIAEKSLQYPLARDPEYITRNIAELRVAALQQFLAPGSARCWLLTAASSCVVSGHAVPARSPVV